MKGDNDQCPVAPLLDLTVATFPVTVVHGELDVYPSDYTALSEKDKVVMDWCQYSSMCV